jgi:hypothetical protein
VTNVLRLTRQEIALRLKDLNFLCLVSNEELTALAEEAIASYGNDIVRAECWNVAINDAVGAAIENDIHKSLEIK